MRCVRAGAVGEGLHLTGWPVVPGGWFEDDGVIFGTNSGTEGEL